MKAFRVSLLCLLALATPAAAQTSPQPGMLKLPPKGSSSAAPAPDTPPVTQAAPVAPVQQVAPFAAPQATPADPLLVPKGGTAKPAAKPAPAPAAAARPAPAKPKTPPVIQAQPNVHAQRPPGAAATTAKPSPAVPATPAPAAPAASATAKAPEIKGVVTGFALPRWASLRSDDVNLRVGPGTQYPIHWEYHRRDLPVQIIDEHDVWRKIQDQDGVTGWVIAAALAGRRGFMVKATQATLRRSAAEDATPVAYLKPGVVGRLRTCEATSAWCEVQIKDYRGYLRRDQFYGSDSGEAVGN